MKKLLLGYITGALTTAVLVTVVTTFAKTGWETIGVAFNDIKVYIDGVERFSSDEPFTYDDRTYVPLRFISEVLGYDVHWDGETNSVFIGEVPDAATVQTRPEYLLISAFHRL